MKALLDYLDRTDKQADIICPHCEKIYGNDDCEYPVSYHAEDGPHQFECGWCEKTFLVEEVIRRYYDTYKTQQDYDKRYD